MHKITSALCKISFVVETDTSIIDFQVIDNGETVLMVKDDGSRSLFVFE